jgi:hypothetical protein
MREKKTHKKLEYFKMRSCLAGCGAMVYAASDTAYCSPECFDKINNDKKNKTLKPSKKESRWAKTRVIGICHYCGREIMIYARNACQACYIAHGLNPVKIICKDCKKNKSHYAKGLCASCYAKPYIKKYWKTHPETIREANRKWRAANKDKLKAIERRHIEKMKARPFKEKVENAKKKIDFFKKAAVKMDVIGKNGPACVYNKRFGYQKKICVYKLPRRDHEQQMYKVSIIDIGKQKQEIYEVTEEELKDHYSIVLKRRKGGRKYEA